MHHTLLVDSGLSFASAVAARDETLRSRSIKSNLQGGGTGFWQQSRSSRIILTVEVASSMRQDNKMFRVLRPTLHTSAKPQYIKYREMAKRYTAVRDTALAEQLWKAEYAETEATRKEQACGAAGSNRPCRLAARAWWGWALVHSAEGSLGREGSSRRGGAGR